MDFQLLVIAAVVYLCAGMIKGTVGIGLPTFSISLLSTIADPRWAMAVVLLPIFATNLWQFYRAQAPKNIVVKYWPFVLMLIGFNYVVSLLGFTVDTDKILLALGVVVIIFSVSNLMHRPPPLPKKWDKSAQLFAGLLAGIMGGLTSIWGPPMAMYLLAKRIEKEEFVLITGAILTAGSLPLMLSYAQSGLLTSTTLVSSAVLLAPALLGMWFGEKLRRRINTERFEKLLLIVFLLLGMNLIRRAIY